MTLSYLDYLKVEGKAPNTLDTYGYHLKAFHSWIRKKELVIVELTTKHFLKFKENLLQEGKSDRTVNAILSCVRGFFDYLILKEVVKNNPVSDMLHIKVQNVIVRPLNDEQLDRFINYLEGLQENIRAGFYLMIGTGCRVGEVAALLKNDFRLQDGRLLVNIQKAKWNSDREVPVIDRDSAIVVKEYLDGIDSYTEPVFKVTKRTFQTYATAFKEETGIDFSCHVLRHTFATNLHENGVPIEKIQTLLGHKTYNVTRHYTKNKKVNVLDIAPSIWQGEDVFA